MKVKQINQNQLTEECWLIQMWGLESCKNCEAFETEDCGGKEILKTKKNNRGFTVPLK